jgi:hypothetical protein
VNVRLALRCRARNAVEEVAGCSESRNASRW